MEPRQKKSLSSTDTVWRSEMATRRGRKVPQAGTWAGGVPKELLRTSQENGQLQREDGQKVWKTQTGAAWREETQLANTRRRTHTTHTNTPSLIKGGEIETASDKTMHLLVWQTWKDLNIDEEVELFLPL